MTVGFSEVTAREKMCSRSSAGKSRRRDLSGFVEKRSMVLCSVICRWKYQIIKIYSRCSFKVFRWRMLLISMDGQMKYSTTSDADDGGGALKEDAIDFT